MSELDDEAAVRTALRKLGVRPAGHAADDEEPQPAPAAEIPPMPDYQPDVGGPGTRRASVPRLPDWWSTRKPDLDTGDVQEDDGPGEEPAPAEADDDADEASTPRRPRLRMVRKDSDPGDVDEPDDLGEDHGEDAEEDDEPAGEERRGKWTARLRRPDREPTRPPFATPVPLHRSVEKRSLAELIGAIPKHRKWVLYAGSGFAAGWYFGIPQFARDATASVAQHSGPLQDNPDVYFWGVAAVIALSLDRATRRSWFLIAWATRGLTVSLIVGALLYGKPNT
ncbi:hypothetical protein [Streptomyces hokutonensis]|uniref:hypothetical protein n=1 Tax=Streptomyces hokutonensis TaxID=1306990 RepID=UPI0036A811FF